MFDWIKRIQAGVSSAEETLRYFGQMLEDGRHVFDLASTALLGGTDLDVVGQDIHETDRRINENERRIRRRILAHLSAYGSHGVAGHLVMMSLVKDAERIGDYSKNLFELARQGRGLPEETLGDLGELRTSISRMLSKARNIYETEDEAAARRYVEQGETIARHCGGKVTEMLLRRDEDGRSAGGALAYRYMKRVNAHALNIVTSVLVPIDRLDFLDEREDDREGPAATVADDLE